jgi:hypothetical protein
MKVLDVFLVLVSLAVLAGCSTDATKYQYESKADFSNLKTFDWFEVPQEAQVNQLFVTDIKNTVNGILAAKGKKKVSETPDFLIALNFRKQLKEEDWSISDARYGSYRAYRESLPKIYEEGTMILDFVDPETKELLWRGSATDAIKSALDPEQQRQRIKDIVAKILEKFPSK